MNATREADRLLDVARLRLDRGAVPALQDIVDSAAAHLGTPFAVIDVLLDTAQIFLATSGPVPAWIADAGGTPIEWAFCKRFLSDQTPCAITDLRGDPKFRDNPLVTVDGVRAYVGAPLISHHGHVLGGICGLDLRPRAFTPAQTAFLAEMAAQTVERLEASFSLDHLLS